MSNQMTMDISDHLAALLDSSPSSIAKLIAAWNGLSTESQIIILTKLDAARLPRYLDEKIRMAAFESTNAYVRYLAARRLRCDDNDNWYQNVRKKEADEPPILNSKGQPVLNVTAIRSIKQRIEDDTSPLVRYSLLENQSGLFDDALNDPEVFFALAHEARLAKIRLLDGSGEKIASLISYAVDHHLKDGKVSELELFEILSDYVNKPSFRKHYSTNRWESSYDGYGEFLAGKDIEALWQLVLKLPERISYVLIDHLPYQTGLSTEIPRTVLDAMTPSQLSTLLYRDDIPLKEFRKELFLRPVNERLDEVRSAAIVHHFDFDQEEFAEILAMPEQEKVDLLRDLAVMANDLSLVFFDAIHDVLFVTEATAFGGPWEDAAMARGSLQRKLPRLKGWQRENQLRELRLYRLAKQSVPWKTEETAYLPSAELEFLSKLIVKNNTWATFMAFSNAWKHLPRNSILEKYLPRIDEAGEDYHEEDDHKADDLMEAKDMLDQKLSAIFSKLKDSDDAGQSKLMEAFSDLASYTSQAIEHSLKAVNGLKSEMNALVQAQGRQKFLLFIIIGLIVWLIVNRW